MAIINNSATRLPYVLFQGGDPISGLVTQAETTMKGIAGSFAAVGLLGLAFMYLGSSLPIVSDWKASHPKAASDVTVGLVILTLVGSGFLTTLIAF